MEARFPRGLPGLPAIDGMWVRLILALMVLAASASLFSGTAATLNSTTVNPGSGFAAGKLVLSNRVADRNPCLSEGPLVRCDALFPGVLAPGQTATARVTITNLGTLPVTGYDLWSTACSNASVQGAHGSADLCAGTWLTIHDDNHDLCYFPVRAPGACSSTSHESFAEFVRQHAEATPLALSSDHLGGGIAYTLTATIDPALGNEVQGRSGNLDLVWAITQG